MKQLLTIIFLIIFSSCDLKNSKSKEDELTNEFIIFNKSNHLQPLFDKSKFDTLHGWSFGWALLEPINVSKSQSDDKELSKRFTPGQKALYFIWYLDAEVTNGGFTQFYWNNYGKYLPPIIDGLKLIGDTLMLDLVNKADLEYLAHKEDFPSHQGIFNPPLIVDKEYFNQYDSAYFIKHDIMMDLLEKYARRNPEEFVKFQ